MVEVPDLINRLVENDMKRNQRGTYITKQKARISLS